VSVTMQPRNLPAAAAVLVVAGAAGGLDELADGALDELLPQAASSRLVAAVAAAVIKAVCLTVSSPGPGLPCAQASRGFPLAQTARRVRLVNGRWEEARRHCGHVVAESLPDVRC
jgi:hypothetical protein